MAIKTSGPINFQDIINEFGGTGEAPLSDYYRGGSFVPNTNANSKIGTQGNPIALSQFYGTRKEIIMTYTMYGGGGSGGNGIADQTGSGTNTGGSRSGIMLKSKYDSILANNGGSLPVSIAASEFLKSAAGGGGGGHANRGSITGGTGGSSDFGSGGAGGSPNSAGGNPSWTHWGAGGGGGGGDDGSTSYLNLYGSDAAGAAGSGGGAASASSDTLSLDVEVDYIVILGQGGNPASVYNYRGGRGAPGYITFTTSLEGAGTSYVGLPDGDGSSNAHYINPTVYNFRITREGQILWYKITEAQPLIQAKPINSSWGTSGANETDVFGNMEFGFRLAGNGTTSKIASGISALIQTPFNSNISDWLPDNAQGSGVGVDYEAQITKVSGVDPVFLYNAAAGTLGQWYTLNQNFDVKVTGSGRDSQQTVVNLKIREVGGGTNYHVDQDVTITLTTIPGT